MRDPIVAVSRRKLLEFKMADSAFPYAGLKG